MTKISYGIIGILIGFILAGVIMYNVMPGMMLLEDESPFGFEETVETLTKSIEVHEWKIPHVHDLKKSMKKFGHDIQEVKVFEVCHPDHAVKILKLDDERIVSTLMPCRIAVYEKSDGKTYVSRMNSSLMAKPMGGIIAEVMSVAAAQNEEIMKPIIKN
ncbi:MAG: DUF302 domain-containing protein [Candidatus Cloacimonadota bacterium]|nr:DUF302 domain-containing protein [Candidatus Cloacimonadota bacterium]